MLTKYEQETIINYNQADPLCTVYTCDKALMRKLDKLCQNGDSIQVISRDDDSTTYKFTKKALKVRFPAVLCEEKRKELAKRFNR